MLRQVIRKKYSNTKVENVLTEFEKEANQFCETTGKQDGLTQRHDKTRWEARIDKVKADGQKAIDKIKEAEQPESAGATRINIGTVADAKRTKLVAEHNDVETKRNNEATELSKCNPIPLHRKISHYIVIAFAVIVGIVDGALLYSSLTRAGNSKAISFIYGCGVAFAIALATHICAMWTIKAQTKSALIKRSLTVGVSSLLFFFALGCLRYAFLQPDVSLDASQVASEAIPRVSIINTYFLTWIGWFLFMLVYVGAVLTWITKAEKDNESKYQACKARLRKLDKELQKKVNEIKELEENTLDDIHVASEKKEYYGLSINRIHGILRVAVSLYIQTYITYSSTPLPEYMNINYLNNHNHNSNESNN